MFGCLPQFQCKNRRSDVFCIFLLGFGARCSVVGHGPIAALLAELLVDGRGVFNLGLLVEDHFGMAVDDTFPFSGLS